MIKIYTSQAMTGRFMDETVSEANMLTRVLNNHGFECLNPVLEEQIKFVHEVLPSVPSERLEMYWKRDKQLIREADLVLDFQTQNKSDGTNKEIAYARYCLWKPVVRVWNGKGALISRMEDDYVVENLSLAMAYIQEHFGTYEKLAEWRRTMLARCFHKWLQYQHDMSTRYMMHTLIEPKE